MKDLLIGFAYTYSFLTEKEQSDNICADLTEIINKTKKLKRHIAVHPVGLQDKEVYGFAVTVADPSISEYDLEEWLAEEIASDKKGDYESKLEMELDYRERHSYYYDLDDEE